MDKKINDKVLTADGVSVAETVHVKDTHEADIIGTRNAGIRPVPTD